MPTERHIPIEEMQVFQFYVAVADWAWDAVCKWPGLAQDTVGKQLIRACDSVGANLVEGDGRMSYADGLHFFVIARASAREARYWVRRAVTRGLIKREEGDGQIEELTRATKLLNLLIGYRRRRGKWDRVAENQETYVAETDPFAPEPSPEVDPNNGTL